MRVFQNPGVPGADPGRAWEELLCALLPRRYPAAKRGAKKAKCPRCRLRLLQPRHQISWSRCGPTASQDVAVYVYLLPFGCHTDYTMERSLPLLLVRSIDYGLRILMWRRGKINLARVPRDLIFSRAHTPSKSKLRSIPVGPTLYSTVYESLRIPTMCMNQTPVFPAYGNDRIISPHARYVRVNHAHLCAIPVTKSMHP